MVRLPLILAALFLAVFSEAARAAEWKQLAAAPTDLIGRELPPGMGGAWCYVPELKGFLLYGGYSPRLSNEGWLFDPAKGEMKLLWPDDSLGYDGKAKKWRALMPREINWSLDRPGPVRDMAAVYSPHTKKVYLFGGHPSEKRDWLGGTRLGTWELDPVTLKFRHLGDVGPQGIVKAVYDSVNKLIVVARQKVPYGKRGDPLTSIFDPATGQWDKRHPAGPRPGPFPGFSYDDKLKKCVYFSSYGETWTYDAAKNEWKDMKPSSSPPPRRHAAMAFVPKLGVTVLHGGLEKKEPGEDPWRNSVAAFREKGGLFFADTWAYDGDKNEWKELKAGGPGGESFVRDLCSVDTETGALVFYDAAAGIWALGATPEYKSLTEAPGLELSEAVLATASARTASPAEPDTLTQAWQQSIRGMPADSWLDPQVKRPILGCTSFGYNPKEECIYWVGGCAGATFSTFEDYQYNNQTFLFDMIAGKWFQRRSNHPWMPKSGLAHVQGNGCGRAFAFDKKRGVIWTSGGVTGFGLPGTHRMQSYDFGTDRFSAESSGAGGGGSDCGLVYDEKNDLLVMVRGAYHPLETRVFDPVKERWRIGAEHPPKFSQYTRVVYDPKLGVILIGAVPKAWEVGKRLPGDRKSWAEMPLVTRAYTYDAAGNVWQDLASEGAEKIPVAKDPGVAYDPVRRLIYMLNSNTASNYGAPRKATTVAVLDLKTNRWERGKDSPPLPKMDKGSVIYDARRNVVVLGASGIHLYRWKGGCPQDAFTSFKK